MHELSIALSIVEMAEEEAQKNGGTSVNAVHLKLGVFSGVAKDALFASYEIACEGTMLQGSRLIVDEIPIVAFCPKCRSSRNVDSADWFTCPECGASMSEILHGKELEVTALEIA
jgi:hydrogenase nickel incorporation protein HypA/HybF